MQNNRNAALANAFPNCTCARFRSVNCAGRTPQGHNLARITRARLRAVEKSGTAGQDTHATTPR
eukprot:10228931-Lingulodinium_polyedra.AAC.1